MDDDDWSDSTLRAARGLLNGDAITEPGLRGQDIVDDSFLLLLNPGHEDVDDDAPGRTLRQAVAAPDRHRERRRQSRSASRALAAGSKRKVIARSVVVLRRV